MSEEKTYIIGLLDEQGAISDFSYNGVNKERALDIVGMECYEGKAIMIEVNVARQALKNIDRVARIKALYKGFSWDCKWVKVKEGKGLCVNDKECELNNCMLVLSSSLARKYE